MPFDMPVGVQLATIHVHHHQIGRRHHAFRHAGWGHQNAVFVQTDRKIAIGGSNKAQAVQHFAESHNVAPGLIVGRHAFFLARV